MNYVIIKNGVFQERVSTGSRSAIWDVDHLSLANTTGYEVLPLISIPSPPFNPLIENCIDVGTELINGQWTQVWAVVPAIPEEISRRAEVKALKEALVDLDNYPKLQTLKGMTPAQIRTWVDGNVTNLTQAQDAIKTLSIAVSVLLRKM